ncbi:mas-related G-protein coupled receptor MRG-like [Dipodomys merriami]|uniref:mas-related G-protein coupled receptor MRG-like n=1 Tax=Dipodomys merriami TaxID=94247 RepID=UPI003855DE21
MAGLTATLPWAAHWASLRETPTWELDWRNGTESPSWTEVDVPPGQEWPPFGPAVLLLTVSVALLGAAVNGVFCCLLCLWVGGSPYGAYVLSLTAAEVLDLTCTAGTQLETLLWGPGPATSTVSAILQEVSSFASTVELCVLTAMTTQCALGTLRPGRCRPCSPYTSAVVSMLSWALALGLHAAMEACGSWAQGPGCVWLLSGFVLFQLATALVMCVSSLVLAVHCLCGLRRCPLSKVPRDTCVTAISVLLWGLPLVLILCLLQRGPLGQALDLLRLTVCVVSVGHPLVFYLAGRLLGRRRPESLRRSLRRALMSEATQGWVGPGQV